MVPKLLPTISQAHQQNLSEAKKNDSSHWTETVWTLSWKMYVAFVFTHLLTISKLTEQASMDALVPHSWSLAAPKH